MANFNAPGSSGPFHGQLSSLPTGWFQYTPNQGYSGPDQFSYEAFNSLGQTSNLATVFINVLPPATVLPSTPFFNSLRARSIDPARFDFYHPRIGTLIGMEAEGIPATPTAIVPQNKKFNVTTARALYAVNPSQYDQNQPILVRSSSSNTPEAATEACCRKPPFTPSSKLSMTVIPTSIRRSTCTWAPSSRSRAWSVPTVERTSCAGYPSHTSVTFRDVHTLIHLSRVCLRPALRPTNLRQPSFKHLPAR